MGVFRLLIRQAVVLIFLVFGVLALLVPSIFPHPNTHGPLQSVFHVLGVGFICISITFEAGGLVDWLQNKRNRKRMASSRLSVRTFLESCLKKCGGTRTVRRALLVLCIGPLPVGLFVFFDQYLGWFHANYDARYWVAIASLFGLWGLTAGILQKSLARATLGLNVGALKGFWVSTLVAAGSWWSLAAVVATGVALGMVMKARREDWMRSLLKGAAMGGLSFGAMVVALATVLFLGSQNLVTFVCLVFLPFTIGPALFLHWTADAAPVSPE